MTDCPQCQRLRADWSAANATLRQLRRSALVWDYGPQTAKVAQCRAAYLAHRATAHPGAADDDEEAAALAPARTRLPGSPARRRALARNVALAMAVVALVLVLAFLHSV